MTSEDIKHQLIIITGSVPFPPVSLQRQVVLFADVAGVHVFITGESLTDTVSWLVGVQIKVML